MPMLSVVVPVYKVEPYLRRCVDSVLAQTFGDYELILVDDGSPDRCGEICEDYAARDGRVRVIHRENGGLSAARNSGIEWALANSDSEWITFLDSDDWLHPRYLEALYQAVRQTGLQAAVGGFRKTKGDGNLPELPAQLSVRTANTEEFYCSKKLTATVAWGKLYRKQDFAQIRYPDGKIHEDELTTYRLLFLYPEIAVIDEPLYQYFQNQAGIMRSAWSPKHLAEVEGMEAQLRFFRENGYPKAEACAAKNYIYSIYRNLDKANAYKDQYADEIASLKRQLRAALHRYHRLAGVSLRQEPWLYYEAFPIGTAPYRAWKKLRSKF